MHASSRQLLMEKKSAADENDEQACYRAMRWSIKHDMKLTESLEDINTKRPESCVPSRFLCSG